MVNGSYIVLNTIKRNILSNMLNNPTGQLEVIILILEERLENNKTVKNYINRFSL